MKLVFSRKLVLALALASAAVPFARAAEAGRDPTVAADAMANALKVRFAESDAMRLHALVVGGDGEGVALVGRAPADAAVVRRGSVIADSVEGVRVELPVRSVGAEGVTLDLGPKCAPVTLRGSCTPLAAPTNPAPGFIAYLEAGKVPLERLVRLVADRAGVNISCSSATEGRTVSVFLRNVSAAAAVEEICRTTGLWYRSDPGDGVIRVTTMREYEDNLNSFREEQTETFTLLYPNVVDVAAAIYGLYPDRALVSLGEEEFDESDEYDLSRRFRRFRVLEDNGGSSFLEMEPPNVNGTSSGGSRGTFSFSRGDALSRLDRWRDLRREGRDAGMARATISANEARDIARAMEGSTNAWAKANVFVSLSRKNNLLMVRTSDVKVMDEVRRLVKRLDVPTPLVLMEVKVMELDVSDDYNANFSYWFNSRPDASGAYVPTHDTAGQFFPGNVNPLSAATMGFQLINSHVEMELSLMQKDGRIRTLATPTLLVANNEVSRIFCGKEYPFVKGVTAGETVVSESGHVTRDNTVQIEWKDIGTMLLITPNINSDKTVTLRLLQENSERVANGAAIPLDGGNPGERTSVDVVESRSVTGTFVAKDGLAVVAGGLIKETEKEIFTRTPFLGSLPLVGWLFRGTEKVKERTELIVTIRPHIISTPYEGGRISDELLKALSAHPAADGRASLGIHLDPESRHTLSNDVESVIGR